MTEVKERVGTGVIPDWLAGYAMKVPCIFGGCDREVSWWGNQHGCSKGHCCDYHFRDYLRELDLFIERRGYLRCSRCGGKFHDISIYFKAVRI